MKIKNMIIAGAIMLATAVVSVISSEMVWADPPTNTFTNGSVISIQRTVTNPSGAIRTTFTYTVTAQSAPSGLTAPSITSGSVLFNGGNAIQYGNISFDVTYPDVGQYVYTVTEGSNNTTYPADSSHTYTVLVDVRYPVSGGIPDNDHYSITLIAKDGADKIDDNFLVFESTPVYAQVTVDAGVRGSLARKDECFPYFVNIIPTASIVEEDDSYNFSIANAEAGVTACSGNTPNTIVVDTPKVVFLKHGDTLTLSLPIGVQYQVARDIDDEDSTQSDYSMTIDGAALDKPSGMNSNPDNDTNFPYKTSNATVGSLDNHVAILRTRDSLEPTGIFTSIWVWIILAVAAIISIILIFRKTTKKEQHLIAE